MSGLDIEGVLRDALDVEWHNGNITEEAAERLPAHVAAVLREQIEGALAEAWDDGHDCCTYPICRDNPYRAAHLSDTERAMVWHLVGNVADDTTTCCQRAVVDLRWRDSLTEDAERCTCPASDTERAGDAG